MSHDSSVPKLRLACEADEYSEKNELIDFGIKYGLLGESPAFISFLKELKMFAPIPYIVLLLGESGTGKELAARALHGEREGSFIPLNCGGIVGEVGNASITGYKRNSFTGASSMDRHGAFMNAQNGSVFLDEVQLLSDDKQQLLLRILETKKVLPAGGDQEVDVSSTRVIAASNEDIAGMTQEGKFRKDLYYRINILIIRLPPLRERRDDIPLLVRHFIRIHREEFNSSAKIISDEALALLTAYNWPGNVRELKHVIMGILARKRERVCIEVSDLPPLVEISVKQPEEGSLKNDPLLFQHRFEKFPTLAEGLMAIERTLIQRTLEFTNQNTTEAAHLLDVARATLSRKLLAYSLGKRKDRK